jgi:soluble lytic murein transglycosylase-like protein
MKKRTALTAWMCLVSIAIALTALPAPAEEIVVRQDKDGKIVVSNSYTNHNFYVKKSKRVRFKNSFGYSSVPQHFLYKIRKLAKKYGLKESLILAVARAESSFNPLAVSRKGAVGIMQLMPETAKKYGVYNRYNVDLNLEAGVRHLKYLYQKYKKSLPLTLAAYNAGEEAVKKYKGVPPYKETRTYIKRVMKYMGLRYTTLFKPKTRQTIYRIVTSDGRVIITDSKPTNIKGQISIIE